MTLTKADPGAVVPSKTREVAANHYGNGGMVTTFEHSIRPVCNEDHSRKPDEVRNHDEDSDRRIRVMTGKAFQQLAISRLGNVALAIGRL
jgi:hypothetical protein